VNLSRLLSSTTFRLTLVYTALSLGSMLLLLGFIYWATAGYMNREVNATIEQEIIGLAEQYRIRGLTGLTSVIEERVVRDTEGAALYLLADSRFQPLIGNLQKWPDGGQKADGWLDFEVPKSHDPARSARPARARVFVLSDDLHLLVGRDIGDLSAATRLVLDALLWGGLLTLALALASGLFMSSRVMQRLETVNETSREIMDGDLARRVPTTGGKDEFEQLAINLNRMFDRIEDLVKTVHQVSDNIAHDLRTPLTRLRTRLEQCRDSDPRQMEAEIDRAIEDAEELLVTFNALLRIARIESGNCAMNLIELNVADLLSDIAELYEPVASDKHQQICLDGEETVTIRADRDLLFQGLVNLVDNAIKYSRAGDKIVLSARSTALGPVIEISDSGPGIPSGRREEVFRRFYRLDASRSTPGSGLGLSLVHAIIDLHGARISLDDNRPGLRVSIAFAAPN